MKQLFFLSITLICLNLVAQQEEPKTVRKIVELELAHSRHLVPCQVPIAVDGTVHPDDIKKEIYNQCKEIPVELMMLSCYGKYQITEPMSVKFLQEENIGMRQKPTVEQALEDQAFITQMISRNQELNHYTEQKKQIDDYIETSINENVTV